VGGGKPYRRLRPPRHATGATPRHGCDVTAQRPTGNRPLSLCSLPRVRNAKGPAELSGPATDRRGASWVLNPSRPDRQVPDIHEGEADLR
jgi:hypothetical protein